MNRRNLARRLAEWSFKYGVTLTHTNGAVRGLLPERPLSFVEREAVMEANLAEFSGGWLHQGVIALDKANRLYESREALLTAMRSDALEVERSEALVSLLRRGLDAHPLFTQVAAAEDVATIRAALTEVDRPAAVAQNVDGKTTVRRLAGTGKRCPERALALWNGGQS